MSKTNSIPNYKFSKALRKCRWMELHKKYRVQGFRSQEKDGKGTETRINTSNFFIRKSKERKKEEIKKHSHNMEMVK